AAPHAQRPRSTSSLARISTSRSGTTTRSVWSTKCSTRTRCERSPSSAPRSTRRALTSGGWTSNADPNEGSARRSLLPGIGRPRCVPDSPRMSAAVLTKVAPHGSLRLLADVKAFEEPDEDETHRTPALIRLEEALGREFADRLVAALSNE